MKQLLKSQLTVLGLLTVPLCLQVLVQAAHAFTPDPELLKIKGYSPAVLRVAEVERARMEWREPPQPLLPPKEKFLQNVMWNEWTGSVDEFGSQIIRTLP
jgi:hypothetical protein